ncbi:CHAT domain-containing protein [Bradyrhizobium liaoningense]|uniref:CHAT domain-containing protein n=1 Tax=Bradyrhizobium liaoningense TaxID=43992 RepID=UPI001BA464C6|nr:TCAD7 domain-containing protein [Bradyrhizobium liaoningense]MBR0948065.1 CHAT domain-containing protein [Bradyrhizobium liaoningense]
MKDAILLDAGMTVRAALRRLAQHGYWIDPDALEARLWLDEYTTNINKLARLAGYVRSDRRDETAGDAADLAVLTFEDAVRLNARSHEGRWAVIRRQDNVTIFWYARQVADVLGNLSNAASDVTVCAALQLNETTAVPAIQVPDFSNSDGRLAVVLQGNDLIGVNEFTPPYSDLRTRGAADLVRNAQSEVVIEPPSASSNVDEDNAVAVRAFPLLNVPQKVTVGVEFDLEIGLSEVPVVGVISTGKLVLRAPAAATTIPLEVHIVADGFESPQAWGQILEILVANPTKARLTVALVPLPQNDAVRLTSILVHFVVGGVTCGTASRNVVVESVAGVAGNSDHRGVSWLGLEGPPTAITIGGAPLVPDIELDISKPDGNAAQGSYRCIIRNAHGVPVPNGPLAIELGSDATTFAKTLIDQVRQFSGKPLVANLLESVGEQVAEKLPPEFWTVLHAVAALVKKRPITFQLNSSEPYVPWELAVVGPLIDTTRPKFLAAQVAMGRWILGSRGVKSPPRSVQNIRAMAVMAGMYSASAGLQPLPQAIEEAKAIAKSYETLPTIPLDCTEANFKALLDATLSYNFSSIGGVQCVHFAGHGEVDPSRPGDAAIYLSDGGPISPLFFRASMLGKEHSPFIFLNACMVGTGGEMLGDFGGFPGNCLAGGFCGLLAPLWAVNDSVARSIALEFYDKMFASPNGRSVAEILQELRSNYDDKKPVSSYLAYVYYGNPYLKLTRTQRNIGT